MNTTKNILHNAKAWIAVIAAFCMAIAAAGSAEAERYSVFVYSVPVAGEEAAYAKDETARVIPAALKIAGVNSAQRYEVKAADPPANILGSYFTLYGVDSADIQATLEAFAKIDRSTAAISVVTVTYAELGRRVDVPNDVPGSTRTPLSVQGKSKTARYYLFAHLSAGEGAETEATFNDFYNSTHLRDVLRNPGFLSGSRGKLVKVQPQSKQAPGYLALYEFQTFDLQVTIAEVNRRLREGITHGFPRGAIGRSGGGTVVYYARPVGPEVKPH